MNNLRIGRYRQRLYIQAPAYPEVHDTFGQPQQSWNTLGVFWAEIQGLRGQELVNAKQIKAQATLKVRTRWLGSAIPFSPEKRGVIGDRLAATATVSMGSASLALSQSAVIVLGSWVLFPQDASLQVYQVTAGSGTAYTISPAYGDVGGSGLTVSQARFLGFFDTTNTEERNREFVSMAYEIQQAGPI
jgi:Phage head-tail joining protein